MTDASFITALVPSDACVVEGSVSSARGELVGAERSAIDDAVEKRVQEYTAGRIFARQALVNIGLPDGVEIPSGEDRAPVWPSGVVGSITHTASWCAVAVAKDSQVRSIGIDVESAGPLQASLLDRICTSAEQKWLAEVKAAERLKYAKLVFCAKEALYKCQYPLSTTFLGFHAVDLQIKQADNTFRAVFRQDAAPFKVGDALEGRYQVSQHLIGAVCTMPLDHPRA